MKQMLRLEVTFPCGVEVTNDDQQILDALAAEICSRYERANPGRVMWPFGHGFKMTCNPMMLSDEEPIPFDETTYQVECAERADFAWVCAKCGKEQGDHKDNITDPPAGDCDFEPVQKDPGPVRERGVVPMHVYLSAVKGRQDMRQALRKARDAAKDESGWVIEAADSEASYPLYWAGSFGDERDHWTHDNLKAVRMGRKEDAEAVAAGVLHGFAVRIAEHMWCAPRADTAAA